MTPKYFYGSQHILRKNIKKDLKVPFKEYDGNIYSIRFANRPVFIAHLDVVSVCKMSKQLKFKHGKMYRDNSGLGADDRAGISLIMNHHEKINFIFTRDEEIGRKGAMSLALNEDFQAAFKKVTAIVQLDCTGHKVVRGALHGYCQEDLMTDIKKVIPDVKDSHGSFSDLDSFIDKKPGVNLSVGYYNQHTTNEFLVLSELQFVDSIILELNNKLTKTYKLPEPKKVYRSKFYPLNFSLGRGQWCFNDEQKPSTVVKLNLDALDDLDDYLNIESETICDNCNEEKSKLTFVDTIEMFLCKDCLKSLTNDLLLIKETKSEKKPDKKHNICSFNRRYRNN